MFCGYQFQPSRRLKDIFIWKFIYFDISYYQFLEEKFLNCVVSRSSNRRWPARSPNLNPMDFFAWAYLEGKLAERKPVVIKNV